jgi:hypothetical protein
MRPSHSRSIGVSADLRIAAQSARFVTAFANISKVVE